MAIANPYETMLRFYQPAQKNTDQKNSPSQIISPIKGQPLNQKAKSNAFAGPLPNSKAGAAAQNVGIVANATNQPSKIAEKNEPLKINTGSSKVENFPKATDQLGPPTPKFSVQTPQPESFETTREEALLRNTPMRLRPDVIRKNKLQDDMQWYMAHGLIGTPEQQAAAAKRLGFGKTKTEMPPGTGVATGAQSTGLPGTAGTSAGGGQSSAGGGQSSGSSGNQGLVTIPGSFIQVPATSIPGAVAAATQGGVSTNQPGKAAVATTGTGSNPASDFYKPGDQYYHKKGQTNNALYGETRFGEGLYAGFHAKAQKGAAQKPGSGLYALGIDPKDQNAETLAQKFIDARKDANGVYRDQKGRPINWLNGERNGMWGRSNAPSFKKLQQMYPNASTDKLLDVAFRQAMAESSLPPRDFLDQILDPLVMTVLAAIPGVGQIAAPMYGAIKKGVEGGPLAALMGGIQGGSALTTIGGYTVPTALISAAGGAINEDLGTALTLASGGAKGLLEGNWSNLAGTGAGKLATELTGNPLYGMLASTAAGKAAAPTGPVAPIVDKSVKPS